MIPELQTERLVLRPFNEADAAEVQRLAGDPAVSKLTSNVPYPYRDGMAEQWIATHPGLAESGQGYVWAIGAGDDQQLFGAVSLLAVEADHQAEIGFWLGSEFWGRGFMTEAGQAVLEFAFGKLELKRIYAYHFGRNLASGKVLEKLGFKREGCQRTHLLKNGELHDRVLWGLLAAEWKNQTDE